MYFSTKQPEQHEANFNLLKERYDADDAEYVAACYLVAYPDLFAAIPEGRTGSNPFSWYWGPFDTVLDRRKESVTIEGLPDSLQWLARAGMEMFAGRPLHFNLPVALAAWDEDQFQTFVQAARLKRKHG